MLGLGDRPVDNGFNAIWIHCDAVWGNDKTKKAGFLDMELALLKLDIKLVFLEVLKDLSNMLNALLKSAVDID
jgi:hypothetical protein